MELSASPRARPGGCEATPATPGATSAAGRVSDPSEPHTSRAVDQSVASLRLLALAMGGLVIDQVASCGARRCSTATRSSPRLVLSRETLVNEYERRLDEDSLTFIALQQPVANDLRLARALVRIGLRARARRRRVEEDRALCTAPWTTVPRTIRCTRWRGYLRHMADLSACMLRNAVRALRRDRRRRWPATVLARTRSSTRSSPRRCARSCRTCMQDHRFLKPTIDTIFALKGLERVGDHAKNVAEQVLYMLGEDKRSSAKGS